MRWIKAAGTLRAIRTKGREHERDYIRHAEVCKEMKAAGVSEAQAEAMAQAQRDSLAEALETQLATKSDITEVKSNIAEVKTEITILKWTLALVTVATVVPAIRTLV